MSHPEYGFSTQQIHAGHQKNSAGSLAIPIYQSSPVVPRISKTRKRAPMMS
jgi:O-acetylhomoserine/O-acetylserine sulfhydrylase-like pyridoxal-dependent enzyme